MWYVIQVMSGEEHEKKQLFKKLILNKDGRTYDKIFVPDVRQEKALSGKMARGAKGLVPRLYFC